MVGNYIRANAVIVLTTLIGLSGYSFASAQTSSKNPETEFSDTIAERAVEMEEIVSEGEKRKRKKLSLSFFQKKLKDRNNTLETGERFFAEGDYSRARKSYELILSRFDQDAYVNYRMGLTMYRLEFYEEARPYFETALRVDPNIYEAYSTLTASYILEGNVDEAKIVQQRLTEL